MEKILECLPFMLEGSIVTIEIFVLTLVLALPLGLPIALGSNSKFKPLSLLCKAYVWVFRGTPLLLQMFFVYFFFPMKLNIMISAFTAVIIAFVLNYAAYFSEIYRGGINSIDRGQYEAAHALGLNKTQTMKDIILPQTMKATLPPIVNEAIILVKDTALVSVIGVAELLLVAKERQSALFSFVPLFIAGVFYFIMNWGVSVAFAKIEKKLSYYN